MLKGSQSSGSAKWFLKPDLRPIQPGWAVAPTSTEYHDGVVTGFFTPTDEFPEGIRLVEINDKVMRQFVWLHRESDEQVAAFAARWGLLGVSRWRKLGNFDEFSEPCEGWREYSREAKAIFDIAGHIKGNELGRSEDWAMLEAKGYFEFRRHSASEDAIWVRMQDERNRLAEAVNGWIALGGLRPYLDWWMEKKQWRISLIGADEHGRAKVGMMGALARQMILMLAEVPAFAICSACGQSYIPERTPTPTKRNYCLECREKGIPNRVTAKEHRQAQRRRGTRKSDYGKTR